MPRAHPPIIEASVLSVTEPERKLDGEICSRQDRNEREVCKDLLTSDAFEFSNPTEFLVDRVERAANQIGGSKIGVSSANLGGNR